MENKLRLRIYGPNAGCCGPNQHPGKCLERAAAIWYVCRMEDLQEFKRYKIGQAAKEIGVKTYVLRFWEGEFEELEPIRTESGQRLYTEDHLELVREIKRLLYDEGLTIDGAKKRLNSREHSDILNEVRDELLAIKRLLKR